MSVATVEAKVLSVLKTIEHDAAAVLGLAAKLTPEIEAGADLAATAAGYPEIAAAINKIGAVVVGAGAIVTAAKGAAGTGADKLAVAAPQVDAMIKNSGFLGNKAIADLSKWDAAVKGITGYIADLYDSLVEKPGATAASQP